MKINETIIKKLLFLLFCCAFVNQSKSSLIELIPLEKSNALHNYIKENFFIITNQLQYDPRTTIKDLERKHNQEVSKAFSNVLHFIDTTKTNKHCYDRAFVRNYFFIKQVGALDQSLNFTLRLDSIKNRRYITDPVEDNVSDETLKTIAAIETFINYLSNFQEVSVEYLATLFNCKKYLQYYQYIYGKRFNLLIPNSECTIL